MQSRSFIVAVGVFAASSSLASAAPGQSPPEPASTARATGAEPAPPPSPLSVPTLLVEDPRRELPQNRRPHRTLLITGLVVLGSSYAASAIVGARSERTADEKLLVPVAGPWLDLKTRDCGVKACGNENVNQALLIGAGALQGLGALSILLSFIIPEPRERPWYVVAGQKLYLVPQVGRTSGVSAVGEF